MPLIEIIEDLLPPDLHAETSTLCQGKNWYFERSDSHSSVPFWKMDLDGFPTFDAVWEIARPKCEQLAGRKLRVVGQYANGHTYGLGSQPHCHEEKPGTFTLLYDAMTEWRFEWQGETVFHDEAGEIVRSVMPRPNRAVFFDACIPYTGRAPSRSCPALRITVVFKLEPVETAGIAVPAEPFAIIELQREGPRRIYRILAGTEHVSSLLHARLQELAGTIRLPGFRAGKIPMAVLEARYGARSREGILTHIGAQAAERILAGGGLPAAIQIAGGVESGAAELHLTVTHLPDLPDVDCAAWQIEKLTANDAVIEETGLSAWDAKELLTAHLHQQVLDHLDSAYAFPLAAMLVECEFAKLHEAAKAQWEAGDDTAEVIGELRGIAERRVRLGAVVAELARRHRIGTAAAGRVVEGEVIDWLLFHAQVVERSVTAEELRSLSE